MTHGWERGVAARQMHEQWQDGPVRIVIGSRGRGELLPPPTSKEDMRNAEAGVEPRSCATPSAAALAERIASLDAVARNAVTPLKA